MNLIKLPEFKYHSGSNLEHVVYMDNPRLIEELFQGEFGVTCSKDKKPVLATYALGTDIGVAGYDKNNKIAFLCHFNGQESFPRTNQVILEQILKYANKKPEFELTLLRGYELENHNYPDITNIKSLLDFSKQTPMRIIYEDLGKNIGSIREPMDRFEEREALVKTLLIDSRDGKIYRYDHKANEFSSSKKTLNDPIIMLRFARSFRHEPNPIFCAYPR